MILSSSSSESWLKYSNIAPEDGRGASSSNTVLTVGEKTFKSDISIHHSQPWPVDLQHLWCGNTGTIFQWLSSFLHDQGQRVAFGRELTQWHPVELGVPPGVNLFPMLSKIYTHHLAQTVWRHGLDCQYDDTQFYLLLDCWLDSIPHILDGVLLAIAEYLRHVMLTSRLDFCTPSRATLESDLETTTGAEHGCTCADSVVLAYVHITGALSTALGACSTLDLFQGLVLTLRALNGQGLASLCYYLSSYEPCRVLD